MGEEEKTRTHDGRADEAEEDGGGDEVLEDLDFVLPLETFEAEAREQRPKFDGEITGGIHHFRPHHLNVHSQVGLEGFSNVKSMIEKLKIFDDVIKVISFIF